MNVQISTRVSEKTKREAEKVLAKYGLDMASALRLFVTRISVVKDIPFKIGRDDAENTETKKPTLNSENDGLEKLFLKYPALRKAMIYTLEDGKNGVSTVNGDFSKETEESIKKFDDAWEM
jgi:addiction module RelB/DinJ family antitoxin